MSDSDLPIIDLPATNSPPRRSSSAKIGAATMLRLCLIFVIAVAMRQLVNRQTANNSQHLIPINASDVQPLLSDADQVNSPVSGLQEVVDSAGITLGFAATTLPDASQITGYRGVSNVLLMLDERSTVTGARLLHSQDTPEHVDAILNDATFFSQFVGWEMGQPQTFRDVDATTGATLTSLAIAEGIALRLGSEKPSLRFPDEISNTDLALVFDDVTGLRAQPLDSLEAEVINEAGDVVARLLRTGPLVDSIAGYQGPSEVIIAIDTDGRVLRLALRRTFDNQPYAGYLNEETYFWKVFQQQRLQHLAQLDPEAEQIEGVSGATMTSLAVADTIVAAAKRYRDRQQEPIPASTERTIRWGLHDTGTLAVLLGGLLVGMTRQRGSRIIRLLWNLTLVIYFGLITGNLISLAVVMGWAASGIAWTLAPGLALVIAVSLLIPPLTKRNLYCSHLCPHGAAQQLLKNRFRTRFKLSPQWLKRMRWIPGVILLLAAIATLSNKSWNLAAWEPFNAYIWRVAGVSSLVLAIGSLVISAFVPMAWCRYGCGTGRLLEYLRRSAAATRIQIADIIAAGIAITGWTILLLS